MADLDAHRHPHREAVVIGGGNDLRERQLVLEAELDFLGAASSQTVHEIPGAEGDGDLFTRVIDIDLLAGLAIFEIIGKKKTISFESDYSLFLKNPSLLNGQSPH